MIYLDELKHYEDAYSESEKEPLRIAFHFLTAPAGYGNFALDSILSRLVVDKATNGRGVRKSAEPYYIPLPLEKLWSHPTKGLPLWNSTNLFPVGLNEKDTAYWHKRAIRPEFLGRDRKGSFKNVKTTKGKFKEYRIPLPVNTAKFWYADCVGNAEEISRLLHDCDLPSIGKKRVQSYGKLKMVTIESVESVSVRNNRPVPEMYANKDKRVKSFMPQHIGWTPPYWLPACQDLCFVQYEF